MEETLTGKHVSYKSTFAACVTAIVNQAVIANITALLFVSFMQLYGFGIWQLGVLVGVNFCAQLIADVVLTVFIDKCSYRALVLTAVAISSAGLIVFALFPLLPFVSGSEVVYAVMLAATVLFSFSGGMLEVIITPITDAIPDSKSKSGTLALMHSFYAWGQVLVIAVTSLYILFVGADKWNFIVLLWALLPISSFVLFSVCPINRREGEKGLKQKGKTMFSPYMLIAMLAIFSAGGTEIIMNQYVSSFATLSLGFDKFTADMAGMCLFAFMMGVGRTVYGVMGDRLNMNVVLVFGSFSCVVLYLIVGLVPVAWVALAACVLCGLAASLLWPGTLVVASKRFPSAGAWIFALLAICGDLGASILPTATGFIADSLSLNAAFVICAVIPLVNFICNVLLFKSDKKSNNLMTRS